mgnify:CR=1 FL=1
MGIIFLDYFGKKFLLWILLKILYVGLARCVTGESPNYLKPVMMVVLFRDTVLKVCIYSKNML